MSCRFACLVSVHRRVLLHRLVPPLPCCMLCILWCAALVLLHRLVHVIVARLPVRPSCTAICNFTPCTLTSRHPSRAISSARSRSYPSCCRALALCYFTCSLALFIFFVVLYFWYVRLALLRRVVLPHRLQFLLRPLVVRSCCATSSNPSPYHPRPHRHYPHCPSSSSSSPASSSSSFLLLRLRLGRRLVRRVVRSPCAASFACSFACASSCGSPCVVLLRRLAVLLVRLVEIYLFVVRSSAGTASTCSRYVPSSCGALTLCYFLGAFYSTIFFFFFVLWCAGLVPRHRPAQKCRAHWVQPKRVPPPNCNAGLP